MQTQSTSPTADAAERFVLQVKASQVPAALRLERRPSVLDDDLGHKYSLFRSLVMFCGFLMATFTAAAVFVVLFHETYGLASPRLWWLCLTGINLALLLYAAWSWLLEEVKGRRADSWLGAMVGEYIWSVARGEREIGSCGRRSSGTRAASGEAAYVAPAEAWTCRWGPCVLCCACYLYRSFWQHCTVERLCMDVWPRRQLDEAAWPWAAYVVELSLSPLMGRLVASVGEYAFVTRCMIPNTVWGRDAWLKPVLTAMVTTAEIVSDIGVVKRHYGFFALENSIWLVMFALLFLSTLRCKWVAYSRTDASERPSVLVSCRMLALALSAVLITYNAVEDVPMYWRLYQEKVVAGQADARSPYFGQYDLPFVDGVRHGFRCQTMLSMDDGEWRPVMLWMSLNYVSLPIWMCALCAITHRHAVLGFNEARSGKGKSS